MTQEEKRIKIAEAFGWTDIYKRDNRLLGTCSKPEWQEDSPIPDYFTDLNACYEMEKMLSYPNQTLIYEQTLAVVAKWNKLSGYWSFIHAAATQRAEAFGKTLKLW